MLIKQRKKLGDEWGAGQEDQPTPCWDFQPSLIYPWHQFGILRVLSISIIVMPFVHVCVHARDCMCVHALVCVCASVHVCVTVYAYVCAYLYVHMFMHVGGHACIRNMCAHF